MDTKKYDESVIVFTCRGKETLCKFNGSDAWTLDPKRVAKCKYLICVNNAKHPLSENTKNHGEGFLVGRISGVVPTLNNKYPDRHMIEFDEFAEIETPVIWEGKRNPVSYIKTEDFSDNFRVDLDSLDFRKVPERDMEYVSMIQSKEGEHYVKPPKSKSKKNKIEEKKGLSISDAKLGLSIKYEIPVENIEIIMKG